MCITRSLRARLAFVVTRPRATNGELLASPELLHCREATWWSRVLTVLLQGVPSCGVSLRTSFHRAGSLLRRHYFSGPPYSLGTALAVQLVLFLCLAL